MLDLRGNGGGLLEEAVLTASIFLPEDEVVVTTDSRTQGHAVYKTVGDNLPALPMVVLIDRNTASAAEILTAALADDAGAEVVGTRSYGKGVFQQEIGLSNGGALKLTIGEYFTPDGVNLARATASTPTCRRATTADGAATRRLERALEVLARSRTSGEQARLALLPGAPAGARRGGGAGEPRNAREAVEALLGERLGRRGFPAALEVEAGRAADAAESAARSAAATSPSCPPSPSTRRRRATSTTRSRPSARRTACASGSTSPTSPPTCGPARRSTSRRAGAPTAPTCRARSSRCCRGR